MHCTTCNSLMAETRRLDLDHTRQTWHECPACRQIQLSSRLTDRLAGNAEPQRRWLKNHLAASISQR